MDKEEKAVLNTERRYHTKELRTVNGVQMPAVQPRQRRQHATRGMRQQRVPGPPLPPRRMSLESSLPEMPPILLSSGDFGVMNPPGGAFSTKFQQNIKSQTTNPLNTGQASAPVFTTGNKLVDTMFSGLSTSGSRMPDPYTSVRTFTTAIMTNGTISPNFPTSGTTTFGGFAMLVNGSGVATIGYPTLLPSAIGSDVGIDWTGSTMTVYNGGINSSSFVSRPSGISLQLDVHSIGPLHDFVINAFPLLPRSITASTTVGVSGWPAYLSNGLTTVQSTWGGRTWTVPANARLSFAFSPMDNRSFDFEAANSERGDYAALGQIAWGGWLIWGWGMTEGDRILLRMTYGEECALVPSTTTAYAYPASRNPANPTAAAAAKDQFSGLLDKGLGAVEFIYDKVAPVTSKIYSFLTDDNLRPLSPKSGFDLGATANTCFTGFMSAMCPPPNLNIIKRVADVRPPLLVRNREEHKEEKAVPDLDDCVMPHLSSVTRAVNALTDPPEIVTPVTARRPSIAKSLTGRRGQ